MKHLTSLVLALVISLAAAVSFATDVNTYDAATIAADLKGVGTIKAEAIIAAREEGGDFIDGADLIARVKGIGPIAMYKIRAYYRYCLLEELYGIHFT